MQPILCVGETLDEREAGDDRREGRRPGAGRVRRASRPTTRRRCVVAYEPIWAIGTGRNATPDDANATIGVIRDTLREIVGDDRPTRCASSTAAA